MTIRQFTRVWRTRTAALLAAVLFLSLPCGALAEPASADREADGFRYAINPDGETVTITCVNADTPRADVPATLGGLRVTAIGDYAFDMCFSLEQITLPDTVTDISAYAFCVKPGEHGMLSLELLASIEVAADNPVYASRDGVLFDQRANALHTYPSGKQGDAYQVPDGIAAIGANAFTGSYALRVALPESLTEIGDNAFYASGLSEITIPAGVARIGPGALSYNSLSAIGVDPGNPAYEARDGVLFDRNENILHTYPIARADAAYAVPEGVTYIAERAFMGCRTLKRVTLPDSLRAIGDSAFRSCGSLEAIGLPDGLLEIGGHAFASCYGLTVVAIPESATYIGDSAFCYASSLAAIEVDPDNPIYASPDGVLIDRHDHILHTYPCAREDEAYAVPDGIDVIADNAFNGNEYIVRISMPDTVTAIGESAFEGCSALEEVTLSESLTEIGEWAFWFCFSLEEMTLPVSLAKIGEHVFDMTTIYVHEGSYAERYAEENEMVYYEVIEEE